MKKDDNIIEFLYEERDVVYTLHKNDFIYMMEKHGYPDLGKGVFLRDEEYRFSVEWDEAGKLLLVNGKDCSGGNI